MIAYLLCFVISSFCATEQINLGQTTLFPIRGGTGSSSLTGLLKGNGANAIRTAVAGTDYLNDTTGNWTGTLDGYEASALLDAPANTDALSQGVTNLYWSNTLFDNRLSASTSISGIQTLPNLTSVGTIGTGVWQGTAIADGFIASAATWNAKLAANGALTGTFDGQEGTYYLDFRNLTNTATSSMASITTLSNLVSVGTITTGVWDGTDIADGAIASSATWNGKESALTFNSPLSRSVNAISCNCAYPFTAQGIGHATTSSLYLQGTAGLFASSTSFLSSTTVFGSINVGTLTATSGTSYLNALSLGTVLSAANIADAYLLNNGDVGTGVFDFGGATSIEIPNGTAPVFANTGEIGFDTTDMQLLIASTTVNNPLVIPTTQRLYSATIASTSVDFVSGGRIPLPIQRDGYVIKEIWCHVESGTSVIINVDTSAGGANTDAVTCATTATSDTAMSANNVIAAQALMELEIGTITGPVDYVSFSVWGVWTRE